MPHLAASSPFHFHVPPAATDLPPSPPLPPLRVGLLGLGTVGAGTLAVLRRNQALIARRTGRRIVITHVAARNLARAAALAGPDVAVLASAHDVATHPDVDVVVEAVGGTTAALDWVLAALASGKHVVTANKALLAECGQQVFAAAQAHGRVVAFEGAVAVSIPIIKALREGLGANRIEWLAGIINGTSNFILSAMHGKGLSFDAALAQAQQLGYAEADPAFDVDGVDAAHKLTLLAAVAFGMPLRFDAVQVQGIRALQAADMACAQALGYRIKLLGVARRVHTPQGEAVALSVQPTLIPATHMLAGVDGALNGIVVQGDACGPTLHGGAGAGGEQTGSAVVADLMDIARLDAHAHARQADTRPHPAAVVPLLGMHPWAVEDLPVLPADQVVSPHYLRVPVHGNHHAALSEVARCLAAQGVPLLSIFKGPASLAEPPCLVALTQPAPAHTVQASLAAIQALPMVSGAVVSLRVETLDAQA